MLNYFKIVLVLAMGLTLGLWASAFVLSGPSPFDRVQVGPWEIAAQAGSMNADPFELASLERSGEIPLAVGEGLQLIARTDDAGLPLDSRCVYRIGPHAPEARYWTLSPIDFKGWPIGNAADRLGLRSSEIVRNGAGEFAVIVAAEAQPGNWLPIGTRGPFALALRLYDTPLGATASKIDRAAPPTITTLRCG